MITQNDEKYASLLVQVCSVNNLIMVFYQQTT